MLVNQFPLHIKILENEQQVPRYRDPNYVYI